MTVHKYMLSLYIQPLSSWCQLKKLEELRAYGMAEKDLSDPLYLP